MPKPKLKPCSHLDQIKVAAPEGEVAGCEDCLKMGGTWLHLRMCLSCGHIACCESSPNKHALKHFQESGHVLIQSVEPGESWGWCYADETFVKDIPLPE